MNRRRIIGGIAALAAILPLLLYSCGGGGGRPSPGTVALFLTDSIADYQQVTATINKIQLFHTGSGASCDVLTGPVTVDVTNLAGVMQLIELSSCPAVPYNRIRIDFAKSVELMNLAGATSSCAFTSYLNEQMKPNALTCGTDACILDISGAVNVLANKTEKLALDFDLKNFSVAGFGTQTCQVTMKVSPLHAADMGKIDHLEAFTGLVSNLSATDRTFTLTRGHTSFVVLYSGITDSQQPGLGAILQRSQDDRLRVRVTASDLDLAGMSITASAIYAKAEGTIEAGSLDTAAHTLTIVYTSGATTRTIGVNYGTAVVEGTLGEGTWVEVKLYGYSGGWFLAGKVEVEAAGTRTED